METAIAFCTTCKGRAQHVEQTLPKNLSDNAGYPNAKFVLLDYNSQDHLEPYLKANHQADIDSGRLVVYRFSDAPKFRMAHAKNMAHRLGIREGADVLVNLDADNFTGPDFAKWIHHSLHHDEEKNNTFLWSGGRGVDGKRTPRGTSGRIGVPAKVFMNAGGYDERFDTWSPDDKDFELRLRRLGYKAKEIAPQYLDSVKHGDKMRFREYRHVEQLAADEPELQSVCDSDNTVVNFGKIGTGQVKRNFQEEPIAIEPLPTRVFGIGLHKTATTSLHGALKLLGFDSAHWKSSQWAKAIWEEMIAWGRSWTLEKHYALSDLPIPLLYAQLDQAYPGSKFILTIRNEDQWLNSVRNHWSPDHNQFRQAWNTEPFSHKVHKLLYGQKEFDEEIFRARYRRHNAEVLEYFKNRPADLLVMNMSRRAGWKELCGFLGRPSPAVDYPMSLVTPDSL